MNLHGASAVHQARQLAAIALEMHRDKERCVEGVGIHETESPTLAGYIVYVVTVLGFMIACVLAALR